MTRISTRIVVASVVAAIAWSAVARTQPPDRFPAPVSSTASGEPKIVGSMSCASASCHGATVPHGTPGGEFSTFSDADPHRRAYSVLFQERSKRMVKLLAGGEPVVPAHRNELCLKCHGAAPPNAEMPAAVSDLHASASCENCHGAAGDWLTSHYTREWMALDSREKAARGMVNTKDFAVRTKVCAGCHVGEPGREVDHQLIAAGHPALRFEITAYSTPPVYAKHWKSEKGYGPDAEAWLWAIGQVGTAKAAAELLRDRAEKAETAKHDWPEFAEYSCFACHRGVIGETSTPVVPGKKSGALPWGRWAYPQVLEIAAGNSPAWLAPPAKPDSLLKLAKLYEANDRPSPAAAKKAATDASKDLDAWLVALQNRAANRSSSRPLSPTEIRDALRIATVAPPGFDWDGSTQRFLASAVLYRGMCAVDPAARSTPAEQKLRGIADQLQFPRRQDGPRIEPIPETAWRELRTLLKLEP